MKKVLLFVLAVAMFVAVTVVPALAYTKADLLTEGAKSPVYHHVKVAIENAAKTVEVTEDQANQIMPYVKHIVSLLPEDLGASAHNYPRETIDAVLADVDEICKILSLHYEFVPAANPAHEGDNDFTIYNEAGEKVFEFDGDAVAKTDAAPDYSTVAVAVSGVALLFAGIAMFVVARKKLVVD